MIVFDELKCIEVQLIQNTFSSFSQLLSLQKHESGIYQSLLQKINKSQRHELKF